MSVKEGLIFVLILSVGGYLALKNADGLATIFKAGGPQTVSIIGALQGR